MIGLKPVMKGLALAAVLAAAGSVSAFTTDPETVITPEARGVAQAVTAAELAAWGRERGDAGALIMAARLLSEVPVRQGEGPEPILTPARLLDEAAALSAGNQPIIDAIDRLREPMTRGVRSSPFGAGPVFTVKQLRARESWTFDVDARAGEVLRVAAIGDGDTDIDLTVQDQRGATMCRDGFGDHYPVCTVSSRAGGKMRVALTNRGDVRTSIQVLSN
ncbi:hypothetical protein [Brevundimonas sp. M20]|uniref:hypothetical protein n=1 Tax=Brevundimonas sp. M20 TaxID=2591463 RepID=UPI0011468055|nr:hypothetical protein [Brevundimonas sp. M20]QDH74816.1 hypothetical protein FKQ52_16170 [Brevundimonas sp. M20]